MSWRDPEYLENSVSEEDPVRVIDVFVDELDPGALGFAGVVPEATGGPTDRLPSGSKARRHA